MREPPWRGPRRCCVSASGTGRFGRGSGRRWSRYSRGEISSSSCRREAGSRLSTSCRRLCGGGLTLVVSPLISLMKDQVDELTRKGVAATFVNSSLSLEEQRQRIEQATRGALRLLYVAPERFRNEAFLAALRRVKVVAAGGGRGALHIAVGARFPAGLPAAGARAAGHGQSARYGADGDGDSPGAAGYRDVARAIAVGRGRPRPRVRPAEPAPGGRADA